MLACLRSKTERNADSKMNSWTNNVSGGINSAAQHTTENISPNRIVATMNLRWASTPNISAHSHILPHIYSYTSTVQLLSASNFNAVVTSIVLISEDCVSIVEYTHTHTINGWCSFILCVHICLLSVFCWTWIPCFLNLEILRRFLARLKTKQKINSTNLQFTHLNRPYA